MGSSRSYPIVRGRKSVSCNNISHHFWNSYDMLDTVPSTLYKKSHFIFQLIFFFLASPQGIWDISSPATSGESTES